MRRFSVTSSSNPAEAQSDIRLPATSSSDGARRSDLKAGDAQVILPSASVATMPTGTVSVRVL